MPERRQVLYPGSFDPVTYGHIDVVTRAAQLFDRVIVAVGDNPSKESTFSVEERENHLRMTCGDIPGVQVTSFSGLLTDAVREFDVSAVIRGLRAVSDFEWEFQMALMNRELDPACETVFLMPSPEYSFVSSTMIKQIARLHGRIDAFVPEEIAAELLKRFEAMA